jgi:malonyl-CoA O-methyltransferase
LRAVFSPDRKLVASRFSEASPIYDHHAQHHLLIAGELMNIAAHMNPRSVLELGCGTGILSMKLNESFPMAKKVFTDGACGMVQVCRSKIPASDTVNHRVWDFEEMICDTEYGLVISSCALQWLCDPASFAPGLFSLVEPGGVTVHAIPVRGMLGELEQSFSLTGGEWNSLNYLRGYEWNNLFLKAGFDVKESYTRDFTVHYPSAVDALRALRGIGASLSGHSGAVSIPPVSLRKALAFYQREFSGASGAVPASYRIHFLSAERRQP